MTNRTYFIECLPEHSKLLVVKGSQLDKQIHKIGNGRIPKTLSLC